MSNILYLVLIGYALGLSSLQSGSADAAVSL